MPALQLTINGTSWLTFRDVLAERTPFKTYGNLRGERHEPGYIPPGWLPDPYRTVLHNRNRHIDYVVWSYATPIAWHDVDAGWVMPDARYSVTTSKAQGRIAPGIADLQGVMS